MNDDLFADRDRPSREVLGDDACLLRAWAVPCAEGLLAEIAEIVRAAPLRQMVTPGGFTMSAAMTNCGAAGWITDRTGYR